MVYHTSSKVFLPSKILPSIVIFIEVVTLWKSLFERKRPFWPLAKEMLQFIAPLIWWRGFGTSFNKRSRKIGLLPNLCRLEHGKCMLDKLDNRRWLDLTEHLLLIPQNFDRSKIVQLEKFFTRFFCKMIK